MYESTFCLAYCFGILMQPLFQQYRLASGISNVFQRSQLWFKVKANQIISSICSNMFLPIGSNLSAMALGQIAIFSWQQDYQMSMTRFINLHSINVYLSLFGTGLGPTILNRLWFSTKNKARSGYNTGSIFYLKFILNVFLSIF